MKRRLGVMLVATSLAAIACVASCGSDDGATPAPTMLTEEQLMDPESCKGCHPSQYREWSGSMHAYAGEDPLFIAMNARMQRMTNGAMGDFCVRCHAPVATRINATTDGTNIAALPAKLRGVTCFFCHATEAGVEESNNPLLLQHDGVMRGGISNPVPNTAHLSRYSRTHDREAPEGISAITCGPCHDIVTRQGAHIERTFREWASSLYGTGNALQAASCTQCHMPSRLGVAAEVPGVFLRRVHDHSMPGVDLAMVPFPEMEAQRRGVQKLLDDSLFAQLCVKPTAPGPLSAEVSLRSVLVGHGFPSGSAQDRRVWVELVAYRGGAEVFSVGKVRDDQIVPPGDANLLVFRDKIFGADGKETHNFWEAVTFESVQLDAPFGGQRGAIQDPFVRRVYAIPSADRITMVVKMRPIERDIIEDLLATGDLTDRSLLEKIPTFSLASTSLEWKTGGAECVTK